MNREDELFKNRITDLAGQAERQRVYTSTKFLTPLEQSLFLSVQHALPVPSSLEGGSASAIRKIAVFGSEEEFGYPYENPIRILHLRPRSEKFAEELSHRDYLGAVMSLGIERNLTGDIVVKEKEAWMFVLEPIVPFLCESLTQIRHTAIRCEEASGEVPTLAPSFQNLQIQASSERIDLLLSGITKKNREQAKNLLKGDLVFVNGRLINSAGHKMRPGDEIVVRGYGKYIYDGISSVSRKGNLHLAIRKYV